MTQGQGRQHAVGLGQKWPDLRHGSRSCSSGKRGVVSGPSSIHWPRTGSRSPDLLTRGVWEEITSIDRRSLGAGSKSALNYFSGGRRGRSKGPEIQRVRSIGRTEMSVTSFFPFPKPPMSAPPASAPSRSAGNSCAKDQISLFCYS